MLSKHKDKKECLRVVFFFFFDEDGYALLFLVSVILQQHVDEHVVAGVHGAGEAPVQTVARHVEPVGLPQAILARVRVRPQRHRLRGVEQQHPADPFARRPRRHELLRLYRVHVLLHRAHLPLAAPERPRPRAVAGVLVVRRRQRAHDHRPPGPGCGAERGPERHPQGVPEREVGDVGREAAVAADDAAVDVEHGRAEEPAPRRDHHVVELAGARRRRPPGVRLVEVEAPQPRPGPRRAVRVRLDGAHEERRPEQGDDEPVPLEAEHAGPRRRRRLLGARQEAYQRVHLVPGERVADERHGLARHRAEEPRRVEAGKLAPRRTPPPPDEVQVRPAVPHAVVVAVDHRARLRGVARRARVRHPLAALEDVA